MANEIFVAESTVYKIQNHDTPDAAWSMESIANAAGRVSTQLDLGATPRAPYLAWQAEIQFQATPTQGKGVEIYVAHAITGSNTRLSGDIGVTDAALGDVDMRRNLQNIGYVVSENAAASEKCIATGWFFFPYRYISLIGYNDSGATINATASNFIFRLMKFSMQGQ